MKANDSSAARPANLVKSSGKILLRNVIRHTDTHNRLREEAEMWQMYHKMKGKSSDDHNFSAPSRDKRDLKRLDSSSSSRKGQSRDSEIGDLDVQQSFLYDDRVSMSSEGRRRRGAAHMDEEASSVNSGGSRSTYWMRQLERVEAQDPDRWGHSGYRELYPDDFHSDKSDSSPRDVAKSRERSSKLKRTKDSSGDRSNSKKLKNSKGESHLKTKKRKKRKKRDSSSSDSDVNDSSSDVEQRKRKERKKKRKKKKKRKSRKREEISDSDSDSDSGKARSKRRSKFVNER